MALTHLIEIPERTEYERAVETFLSVPGKRLVIPGQRMVVTNEHIKALEQAGVKFTLISRNETASPNGQP